MDIQSVIGDYKEVFRPVLTSLRLLGIDTAGMPIDHMCYRVRTVAEYYAMRDLLADLASSCATTIHNGRLFSVFWLITPIFIVAGRPTHMIELPEPKARPDYPTGLEHIELVVPEGFGEFVEQHALRIDRVTGQDSYNPTAHITFAGGLTAKFHPLPLNRVIALQGGYFAKVQR